MEEQYKREDQGEKRRKRKKGRVKREKEDVRV